MSSSHTAVSLSLVQEALAGPVAAVRMRARLQPAGGSGDKVFPPTYAEGASGHHRTKYATEQRVVDGERKPTVLLDSVASQANRMEQLLLRLVRGGQIQLPLVSVDFTEHFADLGRISALEAPHRVYDAILRDSELDGVAFRQSSIGQEITQAGPSDARGMLRHCPTVLLFGGWDSTGPRGGMGSKFQRALVSEVVGLDFEAGSKVGSRLDPLQISASVRLVVPKGNSDEWSVGEGAKAKFRPAEVNHSNIAPSRDEEAGGVTLDHALHTGVLSLPAIRRLCFGDWDEERVGAAHAYLVALGILSMALQRRAGYDFRSRCSLVGDGACAVELVAGDGSTEPLEFNVDSALRLYGDAVSAALSAGVDLQLEETVLTPMDKLVQLVEASRAAFAVGDGDA